MWTLWLALACSSAKPPDPASVAAPEIGAPPASGRFRASWILLRWTGSAPGPTQPQRTEADAAALALSVRNDLMHGADLASLARRLSDDPTGRHGGGLGTFEAGTYDPLVEAAVASVPAGAVARPVRLPEGWAVVKREPLDEAWVRWWTWSFAGARSATSRRSESSARDAAAAAAATLRDRGEVDGADAEGPDGGERLGRLQWSPDLDAAVFALAPGQVSDPIRTPDGWMVVARDRER